MPQARGAGQPFHSSLLPPAPTRLQELEGAIPLLSRHRPSTPLARNAPGQRLGARGWS